MAIVLDSVPIKGLRATHFQQLLSYIDQREQEGWYYGNRAQYEKRHEELRNWVEFIVELATDSNIKIPK